MNENFDRHSAMLRALAKVQGRQFNVTEAATFAGVPGQTVGGKAQKVRRLERAGVIPTAGRSRVQASRFYSPADIARLREAVIHMRRGREATSGT